MFFLQREQKTESNRVTLDTFCTDNPAQAPGMAELARREAANARETFRHRADSTHAIVYNVLETSREARNSRKVLLEMVRQILGNKYRSPEGIFRRARTIQNDVLDKNGNVIRQGKFKPDIISAAVWASEEECERERARQTKEERSNLCDQ